MVKYQEVLQQIKDLVRKTREGRILWKQHSPSTYAWMKNVDGELLQISIQRARIPAVGFNYILQITDLKSRNVLLNIESTQIKELYPPLQLLFKLVETKVLEKGLDAFKKILGE